MELKTIEKALMVFKLFAQSEGSLGTTELANRLNTNTATMSRILTTLKKHEFLEKDQHSGRYRFGPAMFDMARAVFRTLDGSVIAKATPFIDALRDEVEERVHLEVLSGNNIYLAYLAETPKPISLKIGIGDQVMPHAHAGAKAIIAFSQPDVIESWLSRDFVPYTEKTVTEPNQLLEIYKEIRKSGIAYDTGEYIDEINAVGAPIFNHKNVPVAAIIIVVPSYRMRKKWESRFITLLRQTANAISAQLQSTRTI